MSPHLLYQNYIRKTLFICIAARLQYRSIYVDLFYDILVFTMNILDAAEKVLLERGVPMPIDRVAEIVLNSKLWSSTGKTPKVSICACIYADMKRNGVKSRFVKLRAGTIDLRNADSLFSEFEENREGLTPEERASLRRFVERIDALPAEEFEGMIRKILEGAGIKEIQRIRRSKKDEVNFEGFVSILEPVSVRVRVLAARWRSGSVTSAAIDRVRRDLIPGDRGIVFSTRGFSPEAMQAAESDGEPPIALFSAEDLERMLK